MTATDLLPPEPLARRVTTGLAKESALKHQAWTRPAAAA